MRLVDNVQHYFTSASGCHPVSQGMLLALYYNVSVNLSLGADSSIALQPHPLLICLAVGFAF